MGFRQCNPLSGEAGHDRSETILPATSVESDLNFSSEIDSASIRYHFGITERQVSQKPEWGSFRSQWNCDDDLVIPANLDRAFGAAEMRRSSSGATNFGGCLALTRADIANVSPS
jgi:hypothetical protein